MLLDREHLQVDTNLLPRNEWPEAIRIMNLVTRIDWHISEFGHAVALFDCGKQQFQALDRSTAWMRIACREAAMQIFHIVKIVEAINFRQCPALGGRVDNDAIRRARRRIKEWFPYHQDARDAVAHTAELSNTDEAFEKNRPTTGGFLVDVMTANGMVLSKHCTAGPEKGAQNIILRADQATLDQLLEVRRTVHEAFSAVRVQWERR